MAVYPKNLEHYKRLLRRAYEHNLDDDGQPDFTQTKRVLLRLRPSLFSAAERERIKRETQEEVQLRAENERLKQEANERERQNGENSPLGIILCRTKNQTIVEYALRGFKKPIGVAGWETRLVEKLPKELKGSLPTVEEFEAELRQKP